MAAACLASLPMAPLPMDAYLCSPWMILPRESGSVVGISCSTRARRRQLSVGESATHRLLQACRKKLTSAALQTGSALSKASRMAGKNEGLQDSCGEAAAEKSSDSSFGEREGTRGVKWASSSARGSLERS